MLIPNNIIIDYNDDIIRIWKTAAANISMETGIFVEVIIDWKSPIYPMTICPSYVQRIAFRVGELEAETLPALKKILKLKAFL